MPLVYPSCFQSQGLWTADTLHQSRKKENILMLSYMKVLSVKIFGQKRGDLKEIALLRMQGDR